MSDQEFKMECKVRIVIEGKLTPGFDGLAHIVSVKYDEAFTARFGSVMVTCTTEEMHEIVNAREVLLHLEDNRLIAVKLMSAEMARAAVLGDYVVTDEFNLFRFVATTKYKQL